MPQPLRIDFVSDVACPWCVIGLGGLEEALARVGDVIQADLHFQPFELNPDMPLEGQNLTEHIGQKYGSTPEQSAANRDTIKARAAQVGFTMAQSADSRIYNTFDAHRLLHWAQIEGRAAALKHRLFEVNFTEGRNPGDHAALVEAAVAAGLDGDAAREVLASGRYAQEVRTAERHWKGLGVNAVPAVVIDNRYLISGGQPAEVFEQALRDLAAQLASASA